MRFVLIAILLPKIYSCVEMDYIPKDWVDPNDMRYYDRVTKTMKNTNSASEPASCSVCENPLHSESHMQENNQRLEIFIERFINRILQSANLKDRIMKPGTKIVTEIPISITAEELDRLTTLGHGFKTSDLNELDHLLSLVLSYERGFTFDSLVSYLNPVQELFFNISIEKAIVVVCISIAAVTIWMFAVGQSYKKIMLFLYLLSFVGGLAFNAWYMYMEAISEQIAQSKRYMTIPDVCDPKNISWWSYLFSSKNECLEFQKSMRINPLSKVIPSIVFSHTLSMMFIHPLKDLGASCGDFLIGVNNAAPFPLNFIFLPFILVVFCLLFLFVVMAHMGASFNFWTLFGGLSIKVDESKNNKSHEALMDEIKNIKKYIKSEIEVIHRPEAGDGSQITYRKRYNIGSGSTTNCESTPSLENSHTDPAETVLSNFNIFKVNRKTCLMRCVSPKSVIIRKKYK